MVDVFGNYGALPLLRLLWSCCCDPPAGAAAPEPRGLYTQLAQLLPCCLLSPTHAVKLCYLVYAVVQRFLERGGPEVQAAVGEAIRGKALPLSLQVGCGIQTRFGWRWARWLVGAALALACRCCTASRLPLCCGPCLTAPPPHPLAAAASQVYGCRVVQKALEVGGGPQGGALFAPAPAVLWCAALFVCPCTAVLRSLAVMCLLLPPLSPRAALACWCCRCCPRRRASPYVRS